MRFRVQLFFSVRIRIRGAKPLWKHPRSATGVANPDPGSGAFFTLGSGIQNR
jgi:hypothetical protein